MKKEKLDVINIPLEKSNLIEASAGTGKTYSVAILALRLILENKIPVENILMVTFTNAAVAEMELRLRLFIRKAYHYIKTNACDDDTIKTIVDKSIDANDKNETEKLLKNALLFLDETKIFTIHGFCQKTLNEFAFETGQLFGTEILSSQIQLIEDVVNEFWRTQITTLDPKLLKILISHGFSREKLIGLTKDYLSGKIFCANSNENHHLEFIEEKKKEIDLTYSNCVDYVTSNFNTIKENASKNNYALNLLKEANDQSDKLIELIIEKFDKKFTAKYFEELHKLMGQYLKKLEDYDNDITQIINSYYYKGLYYAEKEIENKKKNLLSFDDLIIKLHNAVKNENLKEELNKKYKAVFIDEFQDTDKLQYEIFKEVFFNTAILFFIGDPKQSIYSWRKADLHTYVKARNSVDKIYTMDTNYRSTNNLVNAFNKFFLPEQGFDTFLDKSIQYEKVSARADKTEMTLNNSAVTPIIIYNAANKKEIAKKTSELVNKMLTENYIIENNKLVPKDIGVIVRTNKESRLIKAELDKKNIPNVVIDETKVLNSQEAYDVSYLLSAVINPNISNIRRALLSSFTQFSIDDILKLDNQLLMQNFIELKNLWIKKGVYGMIHHFIYLYQVKNYLLGKGKSGERTLANLYQIAEILHQQETIKKISHEGLYTWLLKQIQSESDSDNMDEFVQRIESDENAVTIITIHKSKGLSYNVLIVPFLDFYENDKIEFYSFRDDNGDFKITNTPDENQKQKFKTQTEQENRRLIYVALTRAVYQCHIISNTSSSNKNSELKAFLNSLKPDDLIRYAVEDEEKTDKKYFSKNDDINFSPKKVSIPEPDTAWQISSFSSISDSHVSIHESEVPAFSNEYDKFVFELLPRGTSAGNFLHELFENIDFTNSSNWLDVIRKSGAKYSSIYNPEHESFYLQLISNTLSAKINTSKNTFTLKNIKSKLPELEFYYSISRFNIGKLTETLPDININNIYDIEGVLHGFIDLFFEYENSYYVLDWKSNFLGYTIEDYLPENLYNVIKDNNYNLQYYIYTIAVKRYLSARLKNFNYNKQFGGIIYVFLRGTRENQCSGIYYHKPEIETINKLDALFG